MTIPRREPTADECESNAVVFDDGIDVVFAAWHPQWGGYHGKCWVSAAKPVDDGRSGCFDVHNYHDGEFPGPDRMLRLHYCNPGQLRQFANLIDRMRGIQ